MFSFSCFQLHYGRVTINERGRNLQNFTKLGNADKMEWMEKDENTMIEPPPQLRWENRIFVK